MKKNYRINDKINKVELINDLWKYVYFLRKRLLLITQKKIVLPPIKTHQAITKINEEIIKYHIYNKKKSVIEF